VPLGKRFKRIEVVETVKMLRVLVETNVHTEEPILLVYADFKRGG